MVPTGSLIARKLGEFCHTRIICVLIRLHIFSPVITQSFAGIPSINLLRGIPCSLDMKSAGCPSPPSYVPRFFTGYTDKMSFKERVFNTLVSTYSRMCMMDRCMKWRIAVFILQNELYYTLLRKPQILCWPTNPSTSYFFCCKIILSKQRCWHGTLFLHLHSTIKPPHVFQFGNVAEPLSVLFLYSTHSKSCGSVKSTNTLLCAFLFCDTSDLQVALLEPLLCRLLYWHFDHIAYQFLGEEVGIAEVLSDSAIWLLR